MDTWLCLASWQHTSYIHLTISELSELVNWCHLDALCLIITSNIISKKTDHPSHQLLNLSEWMIPPHYNPGKIIIFLILIDEIFKVDCFTHLQRLTTIGWICPHLNCTFRYIWFYIMSEKIQPIRIDKGYCIFLVLHLAFPSCTAYVPLIELLNCLWQGKKKLTVMQCFLLVTMEYPITSLKSIE